MMLGIINYTLRLHSAGQLRIINDLGCYLVFTICCLLLSSCVKDKPQEPTSSTINLSSNNKVFIINEGQFQNASAGAGISLYDAVSGNVAEDYFKQQNPSVALGDICQNMIKHNSNYYLVVNNSQKIEVVNASDFKKKTTIAGLNSPRYLLPITYNKAYVSDLYAHSIQVLDLNSNTITGSISTYSNTEQMALIYNKAFVTSYSSNYCYVINTITDVITDSIIVNKGASSIALDKNSKVWVLSSSKLTRINPVTLQTELSLNFNTMDSPFSLCMNKTKDTLYYLNNGICQLPILNTVLPATVLVNKDTKDYYGLGINPNDYNIYVSDAAGFSQKSTIEIYTINGTFLKSFKAGYVANGFLFE